MNAVKICWEKVLPLIVLVIMGFFYVLQNQQQNQPPDMEAIDMKLRTAYSRLASHIIQLEDKIMELEQINTRNVVIQKPKPDPKLKEMVETGKLEQNDPKLIEYIKNFSLTKPSRKLQNLDMPLEIHYSQVGQDKYVDKLLKQKRNGFFVEAGAWNGELYSNTLFFEKERNWTGLLVEVVPEVQVQLMRKNRHAYTINGCLAVNPYTELVKLQKGEGMGTEIKDGAKGEMYAAQCYPLYSILKACGTTHIDYFSLDVEGVEVKILRTLPLNEITIDLFTIEYANGAHSVEQNEAARMGLINFFAETKLYKHIDTINAQDLVFQRIGTEV